MLKAISRRSRGHLAYLAALLIVITAMPAWSTTRGGLVLQYSENVQPALTPASKSGAARLEISAFGRGFRLRLSGNESLTRLAAGSSLQLYKGTLEGVPRSWARISVQDGLPRGLIWDGHELFVVEAAPEGVNDGAAGTVMFKLSDALLERGIAFGDDAVEIPRDAAEAYELMVDELGARTRTLKAGATDGVEISILADAAFLARFSNETQARDAILTRLNNVDGIFSAQLGIEIQVESVEIAGALASRLTGTTDSSDLLGELGQLRRGNDALSATGLTHLFTGRDLDGKTAGIAYTLALCSPRYGASLTMVHNSTALDALITAHEIAHVFGAPHDGAQKCAATPQGEYIMTPTIDTSITSFSQCSLDEINKVIDSYRCVKALPASVPVEPSPTAPPSGADGGGGGSLDPALLLLLLALTAARPRHRAGASIRK